MKILILGLNYAPEPVGIGPYTAGMAEALAQMGHEVEVVSGKPYYPSWRTDPAFAGGGARRGRESGVSITRLPLYVPARPSGAKRILHHLSFGASALLPTVRAARRMRPDIVLTIAPSLLSAPVARIAASLSGAKMWLHIQDLEVEAAFATGLLGEKSRAGRVAKRVEAAVLQMADRISTISPQMCAKVRAKTETPVIEFRNWASIEDVLPLVGASPYRTEWGLGDAHIALYSGNVANKQGIEIIVEAAHLLAHRDDIVFAVCGNGANRDALVARAQGLENIRFFDLQPKERLGDLLGLASVHLLPQLAGAADLVLPSKLTNMLASGRPVVATAAVGTGLADEVEGCGMAVDPGDAHAFANAIAALVDDPAQREAFGLAARVRAEQRWSRSEILSRFGGELADLTAEKTGTVAPTLSRRHG